MGWEGREEGMERREGGEGRDDCYTYSNIDMQSNGTTVFKYQSRHVLRNNVSRHSIGSTPNNGT